jgi:hypothetical protein
VVASRDTKYFPWFPFHGSNWSILTTLCEIMEGYERTVSCLRLFSSSSCQLDYLLSSHPRRYVVYFWQFFPPELFRLLRVTGYLFGSYKPSLLTAPRMYTSLGCPFDRHGCPLDDGRFLLSLLRTSFKLFEMTKIRSIISRVWHRSNIRVLSYSTCLKGMANLMLKITNILKIDPNTTPAPHHSMPRNTLHSKIK